MRFRIDSTTKLQSIVGATWLLERAILYNLPPPTEYGQNHEGWACRVSCEQQFSACTNLLVGLAELGLRGAIAVHDVYGGATTRTY